MGVLLSAHWYNFVNQYEYTAEIVQTDPTIIKPQHYRNQRTQPRGSAGAKQRYTYDCDSAGWNNSHNFFIRSKALRWL